MDCENLMKSGSNFTALLMMTFMLLVATCMQASEAESDVSGKWQLHQITHADGLSNSAISAIYQDSKGYLWLGSWDGLNQFDGKDIIRHYPDLMSKNKLSNNIIWDIFEQAQGLWIVTERGINLYNYDLESFSSWFSEDSLRLNRENGLRAFADEDETVWLVQYGVGLYKF
ncbi:MAG TPA: two-component regulator propeller domain-containing protein, partial [Bacteroidales bacterium]|nr:two-component regulator propeller domain-containing protein [Bacteroidales bacterium]